MTHTAASRTHEFALPNGLRVVFVPQPGAPVAALMIVYRIGSRNEAVGYTGSSHLLEHMLFKGTPTNNRRNGRAFADIMNEIGANKNATTWLDRTNYFETVPSGYLDFAIELEADRMRGAFIAESDRRSEMTVVRNELERADNSPVRVLHTALVSTAFREHPYHHPTIGWRTDVEGVSTDRLRELYDTFYHPGNATVFVVGEFEPEHTRETIERCFGALPPARHSIPNVYTEEPPQAGERSIVVKRPGDMAIVGLAFHTPAAFGARRVLSNEELAAAAADGTPASDDGDALEVLGRLLSRGRTSRLSRRLVDAKLALDVSASNWGTRDPGLFEVLASVRPGVEPSDVRDEIVRVLEEIATDAPSEEETARARAQIVVSRAFARDGAHALAQRLAECEAVGSWRLDERLPERIAAVTPERVRDVAAAYLHEDNRTIAMLVSGTPRTFDVVPFEPVPERTEATVSVPPAALPEPNRMQHRAFADRVAAGDSSGGLRWRFVSIGGSPTVHVRGILKAGPAFAPGRPALPAIVAELLSRGTRSRSRRAIEERLETLGIRRAYHTDDDRTGSYDPIAFRFTAACVERDLEELLVTLAEELREPAFHEDELELVKSELAGSARLARTNTGWRAAQAFMAAVYETGSPHYEPDVDAWLTDVERTTVYDVRAFHETTVLAGAPIVAGAGGTPDARFGALVEETLGGVTFRSSAREPLGGRAHSATERRIDVAIERKANADIVIGRATGLVRASADYDAASLANAMIGRSTLSSRLGLRLREREGLTYGITSAFLSPSLLAGPWRVALGVNPANIERGIDLVRDVLREAAQAGPDPRELDQQRNALAGAYDVALATNAGIAALLERLTYHGSPMNDADTYRERLAAVGADAVCDALERYMGPSGLTVVVAGTLHEP